MTSIKTFAAVAAVSTLALAVTDLSASAQSTLTNGPDGTQPNTLSSHNPTGINGKKPSRAMIRHKALRGEGYGMHEAAPMRPVSYAYRRPLTVRRAVPLEQPVVIAAPVPVGNTGPGTIVTGPLGFASNLVSLPFRAINGIFPATGDIATNPLVLIGAPLHAFGDLAQVPFRVIGAPFGGTTIATY